MTKGKIKDIHKGDVLTFIADDNMSKAIVCTRSIKDISPQNFTFMALILENIENLTLRIFLKVVFSELETEKPIISNIQTKN